MSLDDQYTQMVRFIQTLQEFNDQLGKTLRAMEEQHERLNPLWQDEMRRDYDREWEPLHEQMQTYVRRESRQYTDFLNTKRQFLERYLRGD